MIATLILVAAFFTSSAASDQSGSQRFGGYHQQQYQYHPQQQQYQYQPQQQQQQDRWHAEVTQASYVTESTPSATASETPSEDVEPPPLPEGWSEHLDPSSGQYYYYNAADGTTSWDRPQPPEISEQKAVENEIEGEGPKPLEQKPGSLEANGVGQNPEKDQGSIPQDKVVGGLNESSEIETKSDVPSNYGTWKSNQDIQMEQPAPTQPSRIQPEQTIWGSQEQNFPAQMNERGPLQFNHQTSSGGPWTQSNSTEPSVVGGESEVQKTEFQGPPPQAQPVKGQPKNWGLPQESIVDNSPQTPTEPWGVKKYPEQRDHYQTDPLKQSQPVQQNIEVHGSSNTNPNPPSDRTQNTDHFYKRRQPWQEQQPMRNNQKPPESDEGAPLQRSSPHANRPPQQYPPRHYSPRQYPPSQNGSYNPNAPPGQGQYGGQNSYGQGYPPQPQYNSQPNGSGQLVPQGTEARTTAVQETLSTTWKGLLGFGSKTREAVGTARDQVVTGATAAGQTLSAKSSSFWESAKSTVGGVFENNDSGSQPGYSLSPQGLPDRGPQSYQGRPPGSNQNYPNIPGGPGGRGPPPGTYGGPQQHPGQYQPQTKHGPPQSGSMEPSGRRQIPAPQLGPQQRPPGYPNMQPRRDHPYPQIPKGQERGPIQSQYGKQSRPSQFQGAQPGQQRPPFSGPPPQPNRGPATTQSQPQQGKQSDAWDHPALTGDY